MLLVTGITGHSGGRFAGRLVKERYAGPVRFLLREAGGTGFLEKSALTFSKITGDITSAEFLGEAMKDVDVVLHIAGIRFSPGIVAAAIRNGVGRVILVHTTGRYSRFKSAADEYISIEDGILALKDRIAITVLRPTMIYGSSMDQNMSKLVDYLYRYRFFPVFGSGNNLMQPVHARDLGNAYYEVLMNPEVTANREYNLSGQAPIKYIDLLRTVSRTLGRKNIMVHVPIGLSLLAVKAYNAVSSRALVSVEQVMRMNEDKVFPHDAAAKDFGYSPVGFEEGIKAQVAEYLREKRRSSGNA